ncbi:putative pleiotropic drug resistance protein 7 [Acorus gramineus]|uniref:Pleiotropic drug resistance protein 7 n=1 Tax=Acorus gramineus TaxID=55184 RepID=A0AAV9BTD9_ACOGR|nr:putative pleiotropic drug resistance protein 7 [Acorus gramineus]
MDTTDIISVGSLRIGSLKRNSSSMRRNADDVFSSSSRKEDDEEALKWAALEKLPTYNRMRKGILVGHMGDKREMIDIESLGIQERRNLLERLVKVAEDDNERFLLKMRNRMDRMTLLLGPPGSGKTTLLLALAGKLGSDLKVSGRVTYNGHGMEEFAPERTAAYISQYDLHIGEMTVRETLAFAARCQGVGTSYDMLVELSKREKQANIKPDPDVDIFMKASSLGGQASVITDYILKILGLDICADIMVGDEMLRGISGGQKRRVTTGEMLVGPAKALFMDEISTGLDSSTTFQMINSIRQSIHVLGGTALISLLQPAPETYDLFDDIILLSDGHIVYQGPRQNVLEFFESVGFKCPERKGVADFLQEVTSRKDQQQYWARHEQTYRYVPMKEFVKAFEAFHVGMNLRGELSTPFDKSKSHPAALTTSKFGADNKELLKALIWREYLLMKRNSFAYIFKSMQLLVLAFIVMTAFLRTHMHHDSVIDGGIYMGALFSGILIAMFNGYSEIAMTIQKLPIFYKQRDFLFFPAWAYALPTWILKIPISFVEVAAWVFVTYYTIGFDSSVKRLFRQYFLLLVTNQMASGLFRLIAALCRNMIIANTLGTVSLAVLLLMGGFVLSREDVKKWWKWGYWVSPVMYVQNGISVNEFLGRSWGHFLSNATETLGVSVLKSRGVFPEEKWYWIAVGALFGFIFLFNGLFTLALAYLNPFGKAQAVVSEEALKEKHMNRTGEFIEMSSMKSEPSRATSDANRNKKGMVLPFTPYSITFDDIRYSVDMPSEMKAQGIMENRLVLLKGVSGSFRPGVLTALMGVSGAGKTTLMDVLAGRKTGGYIEGDITISGYPKKQETFARISGYCEQNDIHSPNVTVYESLLFSAWLRLPANVDSNARKMFVEEIMELVELTSLRDALIGLPGVNGLSTEQRKRLTIAVELVANPSIIFMDEPTSGLDARAAAIVMRTVRNTVDTGRTVVCTIHQPSIDVFEAFDEGIIGVSKIGEGYNPATWMLEETTIAREEALRLNFVELYKNSTLFQRNKAMIKDMSTPPPSSTDLYFPTKEKQQDLLNVMGSMYMAVMFLGVQNSTSIQPLVAIERSVFYRERAAGMYSALPYAFAQRIPVWWRWFYWACPVAWTLYGLVASQFGDVEDQMESGEAVEAFVRAYFGFRHDLLGIVVVVLVGFVVVFASVFAFSIRVLNFQKR